MNWLRKIFHAHVWSKPECMWVEVEEREFEGGLIFSKGWYDTRVCYCGECQSLNDERWHPSKPAHDPPKR